MPWKAKFASRRRRATGAGCVSCPDQHGKKVRYMVQTRSIPHVTKEAKRRFWGYVEKTSEGCWHWRGNQSRKYGRFKIGREGFAAHRVAYFIASGEDPGSNYVTHDCDNKLCVNPAHLRLGDARSNVREAIDRGLGKYFSPILTESQVHEIRSLSGNGWGYKRLAARFQVTRSAIREIVKRKTWKHI